MQGQGEGSEREGAQKREEIVRHEPDSLGVLRAESEDVNRADRERRLRGLRSAILRGDGLDHFV